MRLSVFAAVLFGVTFACTSFTEAQDEFDPLGREAEAYFPKQIRVSVEYIDMPTATLIDLMYGEKKFADDTELRKKLQILLKSGQARMLETQMLTARSGEKATTESVREYTYPTEYEPSETPSEVKVNGDADVALKNDLATPPTPTAFETRNTGSMLEIQPTLGENGNLIDLSLAPEIVYHVGNEVWAEWQNKTAKSDIKTAIFYTIRLNTAVTLSNGKYQMICALSPKDEKGLPDFNRKVMVFVKADVIVVGR